MKKELFRKNTGKTIKKERKDWGMSVSRLAKLSHTDKETIEEIENNNFSSIDFEMLLNICDALKISAFSLLKEGLTIEELLKEIN